MEKIGKCEHGYEASLGCMVCASKKSPELSRHEEAKTASANNKSLDSMDDKEIEQIIKKYPVPYGFGYEAEQAIKEAHSLGQSHMKQGAIDLIEQRKLIEAGFTTESLRFKQQWNRLLDNLLSALSGL